MSEELDIVGEIRRHLDREPFEPFVIVMASGDRYELEPDGVAAVMRSVMMIAPPRGGGHKLLRLSQFSSVEFSGA